MQCSVPQPKLRSRRMWDVWTTVIEFERFCFKFCLPCTIDTIQWPFFTLVLIYRVLSSANIALNNHKIGITRCIRKRVTVLTLLVGKWWDQIRGLSNKQQIQCEPSMMSWVDPHPYIWLDPLQSNGWIDSIIKWCGSAQDIIDGSHCMYYILNL